MTLMFDSVTGDGPPLNSPIVAGYVDGPYGPGDIYGSGWSEAAWARYSGYHVTITVEGSPGARAGDCESGTGLWPPAKAAAWARSEVNAGRRPTIYGDYWDWTNGIDQALAAVGLQRGVEVDGWVADTGIGQTIPAGFVALQYAQDVNVGTGHNCDISVTNGIWPGTVTPLPTPTPVNHPIPGVLKQTEGKVGKLNAPIVAITKTPSGLGYTLVGSDGGTFNFGDAPMLGSLAGQKLNAPIIDATHTNTGKGLVMVGTDGGIFCFGDASFHGSLGGQKLNAAIVSINLTPSNLGYTLTGADGGVFCFGDAHFEGSAA